jgi:hypothetical protein
LFGCLCHYQNSNLIAQDGRGLHLTAAFSMEFVFFKIVYSVSAALRNCQSLTRSIPVHFYARCTDRMKVVVCVPLKSINTSRFSCFTFIQFLLCQLTVTSEKGLLTVCILFSVSLHMLITLEKIRRHTEDCGGPDHSVGLATRYGLDGPLFEPRWGRGLPYPSRPALGPPRPPVQWVPDFFLGLKRPARGVNYPPRLT